MSLRAQMNRDLQRIERELRGPDDQPQWLVFGDITVPCIPSDNSEAVVIDNQGNARDVDLSVLIRLDNFDLPGIEALSAEDADALFQSSQRIPRSGDPVRFRWTEYKVLSSRLDPTLTFFRLNLADVNSMR